MYRFGAIVAILALIAFPIMSQPAQQPGAPGQPEMPGQPESPEQPGIPGQQPEPAVELEQAAELPPNLFRTSDLSEFSIVDQQGGEVGSVEDIILIMDGRISHLVVELDDMQDLESGRYLVSMDMVSPDQNRITIQDTQQLTRIEDADQIRQQTGQDSIQASSLMDFDILGTDDESIGSMEDIVVDIQQGSVAYVVLGSGGILGIGQDLHAVPFDEFRIEAEAEEASLDVSEDQLGDLEGFDENNWPESADPDWSQPRMGEVEREAEEEGTILGSEEGTQAGQGPGMTGEPRQPGTPMEPVEPTTPQQSR